MKNLEINNQLEQKPQLVVVIGMHRSGTSAMTRALQTMGVNLGNRLMPPIPGNNDKGFFEDLDIVELNEEILQTLGKSWYTIEPIQPVEVDFLCDRGFLLRAVELLRNKLRENEIFGFKDPRISKLMPFWSRVFASGGFRPRFLLTLRNPLSVVRSLKKREGFHEEHSYLLWIDSVLNSLFVLQTQQFIVVDYDQLLHSPEVELKKVSSWLGTRLDEHELDKYLKDFLDEGLRHSQFLPEDLRVDNAALFLVKEVYEFLIDVCEGKTSIEQSLESCRYKQWLEELNRLRPILHLLDKLYGQKTNLSQVVTERDGLIESLSQVVTERDGLIESLSQVVTERDARIESLSQVVTERDVEIESLSQVVTERDVEIESLSQVVTDARRELVLVLVSNSWHITKPLRFLRRNLITRPHVAIRRFLSDESRAFWRALPLTSKNKQTLKGSLFKSFPWVFRRFKAYRAWVAFNSPIHYTPMINIPGLQLVGIGDEYVPLIKACPLEQKSVKLICFYLPQFHTIPENDEWWGKGFTEWTNVQSAQPQLKGHYQPHVPGELGYYNLLDPDVQRRQVELAMLYGVGGFCFYFYWFSGKRLLEAPIENYLNDKTLDLPFCLCWANENWTRRWDGLESEILMAQQHSTEDDLAFIQHVARYMWDTRYIRINGKPLLLVYRPSLLPSAKKTASRWRDWCRVNGLGEIYLAYTQSFETVDPAKYGFDAAIEFPPNNFGPPNITDSVVPMGDNFEGTVYDWRMFVERSEHYKQQPFTLFRSVCPSWDNTARRKNRGTVFLNNTPTRYQRWLENAIRDTHAQLSNSDERLVFVNAWNEWAEGAHLEPDARYGYTHLNATLKALLACGGSDICASVPEETASRHKMVLDVRWNSVATHFVEVPERGLYESLVDYVALLAQASRHGASFFLKNHVPCCEVNGKRFILDRRESLSRLGSFFNNKRVFCFVILQYNKVELTEQCVASLRKLDHCGRDMRIVIVDNKSSDAVRARSQESFGSAPDVNVLFSDTNLGFSGGNNLGYQYAREKLGAEYMVILNNDTFIEQSDFIRETVELYSRWGFSIAGPDVITSDGRHENPWNDYVYSIEEWETLLSVRRQEREHYLDHAEATFRKIGQATPESEILLNPILQGAAYVVSPIFITDHDKIFDERLFLYGEEFLLAIECLLSGHLTIYTNTLQVRHHEGASTSNLPSHDKFMFGYDSTIKAINFSLKRLKRHKAASLGNVIDFSDIEKIYDCLDRNVPNVLVDLLFCQPGYHGGGEYGKAVFKALAEENVKHGGFQLWTALNPNLFIDSWVWDICKTNAINIIAVRSYDAIVQLVNSDQFDSFFTPAIVVYTGYEYMTKVGSELPFTCKKTRVIGTLHDIRDFELACDRQRVLETRRNIGCMKELKMSNYDIDKAVKKSLDHAEALRRMYQAIVHNEAVDTIVTISSYCYHSIISHIGLPRRAIKILASPQKRRPTPESFSSDKFNPATTAYALLLHATREEKNGSSAVAAFDQLFEESNHPCPLSNFRVVLTGVTDLDQLGLAQIRHPDRFVTLGEMTPEQFEYLLKHAQFLVYPSFNEGFGYPPIEAMTYGVPSIVSDQSAIPEICGDSVIYFDPHNLNSIKNAIVSVTNDVLSKRKLATQLEKINKKQDRDLNTLIRLIVQSSKS